MVPNGNLGALARSARLTWLGLLPLLTCVGCGAPPAEPESVRPVRAIKVADLAGFRTRSFPGRAEAVDEVDLSFRVSGPLIQLPVRVGDQVAKGDLLAAIDPIDYRTALDLARGNLLRAQAELLAMEAGARPEEILQLQAGVNEAQAGFDRASAEHARNATLRERGAISQSEFDMSLALRDKSAAQLKTAQEALRIGQQGAREEDRKAKQGEIMALQASVTDAENRLRFTSLLAPFDGGIAARFVDNFQTVQAQQPILRLLNTASIKIVVQVPESAISLAPLVEEVVCRFDAFPDREFTGRVFEIGKEATRTTRTFPVTALVEQPEDVKILPGMAASVQAKVSPTATLDQHQLTVPATAVFTPDTEKQSYVWLVDSQQQTVQRRKVTTGQLTTLGMTILDGVQPGDWVVTAGVHSLRDGQRVRLLTEQGDQ
ncbi:MAG: efflux RND transporter periplasmic adaptor subunit [Pirellulaceae bacterium]|nr:efflux RND transporter periplasmic adaptor subunit [Pirellulaceae bacterium]